MNEAYQLKIGQIDDNYEKLNREITTSTTNKLLLVIGNSYVQSSFLHNINSESTIKFSVPGMPLSDIVNVVENLPIQSPIDKILVGVGYNYAIPINADPASYEKHFTTNPLSELWLSLPIVRGRSMSSTIIKEDVICLASYVLRVKCKKIQSEQTKGITTYINSEAVSYTHLTLPTSDLV